MQNLFNTLIDFFIECYPYYTDVDKVEKTYFCTNKYVNDSDSNVAIIRDDKFDFEQIEEYFKSKDRNSSVYIFKLLNQDEIALPHDYKAVTDENWLIYDDVKKLKQKFANINVPKGFSMVEVSEDLQQHFIDVNKRGFSQKTFDNPYGGYDDEGYSKTLLENNKGRLKNVNKLFLIKNKQEYIGVVVLTICKNICYVSGLTILPEHRRTKAMLAYLPLIDFLIENKIDLMFCITEDGGYPDALYKKLGFKTLTNSKIYSKNKE